jgi:hypothetical protein
VAVAVAGIAAMGVTAPANATPGFTGTLAASVPLDDPNPGVPTNPDDARCAAMPQVAQCQGGPYAGPPTGPASTQCVTMPDDPVCAGGPYAPPAPPPPAAPLIAAPEPPPAAPPPAAPPPPPQNPFAGMPDERPGGAMPGGIGGMPGHM